LCIIYVAVVDYIFLLSFCLSVLTVLCVFCLIIVKFCKLNLQIPYQMCTVGLQSRTLLKCIVICYLRLVDEIGHSNYDCYSENSK